MSGGIVIAVDGPVAAGKGTLARRLAGLLGFHHLDSGLLYRATAARTLSQGGSAEDVAAAEAVARALSREDLARPDLRSEAVGQAASRVAAMAGVRAALLAFQHRFAAMPPGVVIDGRDIGTVVCPDAAVKLFVTASAAERARRRHLELAARGESADYAAILADLEERDLRDTTRAVAPLRPAEDAVILDTTTLDAEAALETALGLVESRLKTLSDNAI